MVTAEHDRLDEADSGAADWRRWGTYLSERAWGTVREDYSADGDAWNSFPFDHARSRAYRWNEDGLAGWCDRDQILCLGVALWNGADPFLKERPFGLTNEQGNHGEDVKDYWFYTDNTPTHAYAETVVKYPQARFPYEDLVAVNAARGQDEPEYELFDALRDDWLAQRYFDVTVRYAKATPEDLVWQITVVNRGPDPAPIHVLPQVWYRNTWSWEPGAARPRITAQPGGSARTEHPDLGERYLFVRTSDGSPAPLLFCENETNTTRLYGSPAAGPVKDGINDFVVSGATTAVDPGEGSKLAAHAQTVLAPGATFTVTVRFAPAPLRLPFADADDVLAARRAEADAFYADLAAEHLSADERLVQRQALAGLLWCKQYYHYKVRRWLQGDPGQPPPPEERWKGRNSDWQHLAQADVIVMPDAWEYPWYASWDLAFHAVTLALVDPAAAKEQLLVLLASTTQHPHGQVPAYEWSFGDSNPPLQAWAAWQVYQLDRAATGTGDLRFLAEAYRAITLDVSWWLNQKDTQDRGVFGGGFLGMDNIGVFDRDQPLPTGGSLAQVDGTAWMAALVLQMLEITTELAVTQPDYERMIGRWIWDGWLVGNAMAKGPGHVGFFNDDTGFYHDVIEYPDGRVQSLPVFSMQSLVPLLASIAVPRSAERIVDLVTDGIAQLRQVYQEPPSAVRLGYGAGDGSHALLALVDPERLRQILVRVLDPEQFLSDHGVRSLSRLHRDQPFRLDVDGSEYTVDYEPAESRSRMFGGNSNWRGPVWFPLNVLLVQALNAYASYLGPTWLVPDPTGGGPAVPLADVTDDLAARLTSIFTRDAAGRRAVFGRNEYFQTDPHWRDLIPFHEYFDGDDGHGLGASHQTGWTATVALLLQFRGQLRF